MAHACECEHASHFRDMPPGVFNHGYGASVGNETIVVTQYGKYWICNGCVEQGHVLPFVEY